MKHVNLITLTVAALATAAILLAGCVAPESGPGQPGSPGDEVTPAVSLSDSGEFIVEANNRFCFDLYDQLADNPANAGENIFFSPFSISTALAITSEGARGRTAEEIRSVFHFPEDASVQREGYASVLAFINRGASGYILRTANALWAEQTYPFLPGYISTAERYYDARTINLDFAGHPEESRVMINDWVEEQTEDRIEDLIPPGEINPDTTLVITNAIYFKGTWVKQFDPEKTTYGDFTTGSGEVVQVPMMQRTDEDAIFGYAETDSLQVLSMPYASDDNKTLSMMVILPGDNDLAAVEESLDLDKIENLRQSLESRRVMVYFPKFTMETRYFLPDTLARMGMQTAFTGGADFSGMDGKGDLFISNVIHQAFVEVNEEGTEAAAATAVIMQKSAAPAEEIPFFRADHPFIFLVQDDETGNILFMGRVMDPGGA
ncbi:MAG: serpin family protein [Methanoregulaceae archaeon]|jgi:serpin B|nr:serpin family protein [Methanoregulaceae archaeon]HQC12334.1 serpin family protein [Methanoregulaceae archaeon]